MASDLFGLALASKLDNTYLPPANARTAGANHLLSAPYQRNDGFSGFQQPGSTTNNGFKSGISSTFSGSNLQNSFGLNSGIRPSSSYIPASNSFQHTNQNSYANKGFNSGGASSSVYGDPNKFSGSHNANGGISSYQSHPPSNILRYNNQNRGDGNYRFDYETENKISHNEVGRLENTGTNRESSVVKGDYSYVAPNGQTIAVNYIADENGFRASGDHIPFNGDTQSNDYSQGNKYNHQYAKPNTYVPPGSNGFKQFDSNRKYTSNAHQNKQFASQSKPFTGQGGLSNNHNTFTPFANQNSIRHATTGNQYGSQQFSHRHSTNQYGSQQSNQHSGTSQYGTSAGNQGSREYIPPSGFTQFDANRKYSGTNTLSSTHQNKPFASQTKPYTSQVGQSNNGFTSAGNQYSSQQFNHHPGTSQYGSNAGSQGSRKYLPPSGNVYSG